MAETLAKNSIIAHYRIISKIGAGGMGTVYLAEDTQLGRKVALKLLSDEFAKNEDFLRRFRLEARAASALNHPNIVTIYEIAKWNDVNFIAMEYVEGGNLRQLLEERDIRLNEALDIAIQTASALAAAHAAGVVHRDIKPENIMLRPEGLVKVLDFGLAKQSGAPPDARLVESEAATQEHFNTMPGYVMGTPAYMSPEQARGKAVDERTDAWSLGVVLYEMVVGNPPFVGETKSDIIAAILKSEPSPINHRAPAVAHELEHIVKKALGKDREERYQVVKDLLLDLKILQGELSKSASENATASFPRKEREAVRTEKTELRQTESTPKSNRRWLFASPVIVLAAGAALWFGTRQSAPPEANFLSSLASAQVTSWKSELSESDASRARFSPDGKLIAYVAPKNGKRSIWLKQTDGGEPFTNKQDDAEETSPLWSPDGGQIAYYSERGARRGIWVAPAFGGAPVLLAPLDAESSLIHWARDGANIFFEMKQNLYALDTASKQISKLTDFEESKPIARDFSFSPDGARIAYADRRDGRRDLWVADKSGKNPARITDDAAEDGSPVWHADGRRVIYSSNRNGVRQICLAYADARPPAQLTFSDGDSDVSDISPDGTKILYTTTKDDSDLWGVRLDDGREFQITSDIGVEFWQEAAPDGAMIVYQAVRRPSVGAKLLSSVLLSQKITGDGRPLQLANDGFSPRWSPDASRLAFLRSEAGNNSLWVTSAAGGDARRVTDGGVVFGGHTLFPFNRLQTDDFQWSPDGGALVYCANRGGVSNVWQAAADGAGEKPLTNNEDKNLLFFSPIFAPGGGQIAFLGMSTAEPRKPLWSVWILADGKAAQIYQTDSILRLVGWSATGGELIIKLVEGVKSGPSHPVEVGLFTLAPDAVTPRPLTRLKNTFFQNIQLSPDRRMLAFVTRQNGSGVIQTVPSTGGTAKTLIGSSDARVYFSALTFAPDGKTIYFGRQANWQIISVINNFK